MECKAERVIGHLEQKSADLDRHIYLIRLSNHNETLFFLVVISNPVRFIPGLCNPTSAEACLTFGHVCRRTRGKYVTREMSGRSEGPKIVAAIKAFKPTALIGVSTAGGAFTEKVVKAMTELDGQPSSFPIANATDRCGVLGPGAYEWSDAKEVRLRPNGRRTFAPGPNLNGMVRSTEPRSAELNPAFSAAPCHRNRQCRLPAGRSHPYLPRKTTSCLTPTSPTPTSPNHRPN